MRRELTWFQLRFPRQLEEQAVLAALSSFSGFAHGSRLVFRLSATADGITHYLGVSSTAAETIKANLRAAVPSLQLVEADAPTTDIPRRSLWQLIPSVATIRSDRLPAASAGLLASLFPLYGQEAVCLSWHFRPSLRPRIDFQSESSRAGRTLALRHKLGLPGLQGYGELAVAAGDPRRIYQLVQRISTSLRSLSTPHGRLVADPFWFGQALYLLGQRGRYFSVAELAAVIGWPIGELDLPGLELGAAKSLVASRTLPKTGRILGTSNFSGHERTVAISPKAATRGTYILGPTGTGKSSLIKNLVRDDLGQGRGLAVVETNGDLINELCDLIPTNRIKDVVLINPLDRTHSVGFNPFYGAPDASLVADQLGELFQRLWSAFWGPRTAQLAHMGLLSLAQRQGSTLLDLPRLYQDPAFRASVIANLDDPIGLEPDWSWFQNLPAKEQAAISAPLLNKARQFAARAPIRAIVGQAKPLISMQRLMAEGKVLLVYLPKGLIGAETAQLLGCLILTSLWQAATERTRLPPDQRPMFGLYVDEVQDFAASPIPWDELFAQGRKYGLALTVAHQHLGQLDKDFRETLQANGRSKAIFATTPEDARSLERLFAPALTAADLQALDPFTVAAIVALDSGGSSRPVTLRTPPPPKPLGSAEQVRQFSRAHYARPRTEIEAALRERLSTRKTPKAPIGRKPRSDP
jgi:hypothetical protein